MAEFRKNITWTNEVGQLKGHHYLQTAMTKKVVSFFQEKIWVTPSVAAPGDTSLGDATARSVFSLQ